VLVVRTGVEFGQVLDKPPLIVIEILSPDDRLSDLHGKIGEYLAFGIEHVWIFDPQRRAAWWADAAGMHVADGELSVPGMNIRVVLSEAWVELERAM
jgi:Uma2 family endonuclease